jgi:hypothetical protein
VSFASSSAASSMDEFASLRSNDQSSSSQPEQELSIEEVNFDDIERELAEALDEPSPPMTP